MEYPQYAVSQWIGHSMAVSEKHYLQVPEELYTKAAGVDRKLRADFVHWLTELSIPEGEHDSLFDHLKSLGRMDPDRLAALYRVTSI